MKMEAEEIDNLISLLRDMILRNLVSPDDVFSLLFVSNLNRRIANNILHLLVIKLEETCCSYPAPTAQQTALSLLTFVASQTRPFRQLAGNVLAHIGADASIADVLADLGAVKLLLKMLTAHQEEGVAARCLQVLFSHPRVVQSEAATSAVPYLSRYLVDPSTSGQGRLFSCPALANLLQNKRPARCRQAGMGVFALVQILRNGPSREETMASLDALQSVVHHKNGEAVSEGRGVQLALDFMRGPDQEAAIQAAVLLRLLVEDGCLDITDSILAFRATAAAIEEKGGGEELLNALKSQLATSPYLTAISSATSSIPFVVRSLGTGSEVAQRTALDCLCSFMDMWASGICRPGLIEAQARAASPAIPILQKFLKDGPEELKDKAKALLKWLPGVLKIVIKGANNIGGVKPRVYCKVTFDGIVKKTGVSTGPTIWDDEMEWIMRAPPQGKEIHISCKNKRFFGKRRFGELILEPDAIVLLGEIRGESTLFPESKSGQNRSLKYEIFWTSLA